MLREEIYRLKKDYQVARDTIFHQKDEIKSLKKEVNEVNQDNEQINNDLHTQLERSEQLIQDLRDAHCLIEEAES